MTNRGLDVHYYTLMCLFKHFQLENVEDGIENENIIVVIGAVTRCGAPHPTVYPTCFGRLMPADWTENKVDKTVMTVLSAADNYTKRSGLVAQGYFKEIKTYSVQVEIPWFEEEEVG